MPGRPPYGSIVHVELYSDLPKETMELLRRAFGWRFADLEEHAYTLFRAPDPPHGGVVDRGVAGFWPPRTLAYLLVEDLEDAVERAGEHGASTRVEPTEVEDAGAYAVVEAPGGFEHAFWEVAPGAEVPPRQGKEPATGSIVHVDLRVTDVPAARTYVENVMPWVLEEAGGSVRFQAPRPPDGRIVQADEAGPAAVAYLLVEDVPEALERARDALAERVGEPETVEGLGVVATFEAPGGVELGILDPS